MTRPGAGEAAEARVGSSVARRRPVSHPMQRVWVDIQNHVRGALNRTWDPIGVAGAVDDEYDSYIDFIYSMLRRRASPEEVAAQLLQIKTETMGLGGSPKAQRLHVARELLSLDLPAL